jgi:hypothetical protein
VARFFSGLFGNSQQTQPPATSLRVNTSMQGVPIALILGGANRLAGNLVDYFDLFYQNAPSSSSGGGKGGAFSAGTGKGNSGQYVYFASFIMAICEGPAGVSAIWMNGTAKEFPPTGSTGIISWGGQDNFSAEFFVGDYAQEPWGFGEAFGRNLAYRGITYSAFGTFPLGSSTSLPNLTFLISSEINAFNVVPGQPDGDVTIALAQFLTNPHWGIGFPPFRLGALTSWQQYCIALGLGVSPVLASATQAASVLNDLLEATNAAACWQDGQLTVIPYGDAAVTAGEISQSIETFIVPTGPTFPNGGGTLEYPQIIVSFAGTFAGDAGVTYESGEPLARVTNYAPTGVAGSGSPAQGQYFVSNGVYFFNPADVNQQIIITYDFAAAGSYVPDTTPIYDFTIDDCLPNQITIGQGVSDPSSPFMVVRTPRDQMLNNIKVEYLDPNNTYNPVDIEVKDEASIIAFGRERPSDLKQYHFFTLAGAAQQSAVLQLIRQQVARTFQWTVGRHFAIILELMALATVTDPGQGLERQPVRIIEIQENSDFSLTITAEEFLGTVSAPAYGTQANTGYTINYDVDPGAINAPIIFEPTDELNQTNSLGGMQVWAGVSGADTATWGGAFLWVSEDGETYQKVGEIIGPSRMGVTTSILPAVTPNPTGAQTIDTTDTLSVNLEESAGTLSSGTVLDATSLNTRSYVGGEIVSYETATLNAVNQYTLGYLVRGAYGTESAIAIHPAGTPFLRLDDNVFAFTFDQSRIGATIYLKFQSFNIFQGGLQNLANVAAYPYTITGAALASPLPSVANLRTVYDQQTGFTELDWDDITDFRAFKYEIRSGSSFESAFTLGQIAHPPFRVPGNGTYWVAAVSTPVPGLTVYSETWEDIAVSGAVITQNVILTIDLKADNWPGVFSGGTGLDTTVNAIRTGGGNILTDTSILTTADVLDYGGGSSGQYLPGGAYLDIGYVANVSVAIAYQPTGVPVGQNILTIGDFLNTPDILGSASTAFIDVYPIIETATALGGDLYALGDLYQYPDLYEASGPAWGGFQKFSPGTYQARFLNFGMVLNTVDPQTIAYDLEFAITATIPARIDQYSVTTSASGPVTLTFQPQGASSPAPFNGGSGPGNTPIWSGSITEAEPGDQLIVASITKTACTVAVTNGGASVVRTVSLIFQGF